MSPAYRIAVAGAGISGLAAAALLRQQGNDVTVFEQFAEPRPVGSGLVLQQTGLAVLAHLGLATKAIDLGATLAQFHATTATDRTIFHLSHERADGGQFSLGIHRHSLFSLLHDKVAELGIPVNSDTTCIAVQPEARHLTLVAQDGRRHRHFDLIVDASGTHSRIRDAHASIRYRRVFPYGVLWGVCEDPGGMPRDTLRQRFHGAKFSVGLIPIGRQPAFGERRFVGVHCSIRNSRYEDWLRTPFQAWKDETIRFWHDAAPLISQFGEHGDLSRAVYSDIALHRSYAGRIAFIGDAAHSISPRLGQGANLALVDALILARKLEAHRDIDSALCQYDLERRKHVRHYQRASRWLSLLFQSDSIVAPAVRDIGFARLCRIPFMRRQMLQSLSGVKTGLFSSLSLSSLRG